MRASDVCRSRCAWCAATIQITHPHCHSSMQMARESAEREKRRREKRGWQLTHSLHCTSSWHTPPPHHLSSPLFPLLISRPHPQHTLTPSPPLICLTTTSTSLLLSLNLPLLTHTHTHTSQASPNACASAQRKRSSSSSPTARVPHHHQQPMSSSTCMPHIQTQAASGTCVSE